MENKHKPRLYLAGPEVFLPNAKEHAKHQRVLCEQYGFTPLHPIDNGINLEDRNIDALIQIYRTIKIFRTDVRKLLTQFQSEDLFSALKIYLGDIQYIRESDIVVANCNSFRGALIDDGTAYELGFGNALGKPSYGYIQEAIPAVQNITKRYPHTLRGDGTPIDRDGYLVVDDFGTSINLMMEGGMLFSGGRLIEGSFEDCLREIRDDLDSGKLRLPLRAD
jgi:nucleoside 2-deoxyribosyltransferase